MSRVNNLQAEDEIRARRPFDNNNSTMSGGKNFRGWGRLPRDMRPKVADIAYFIYSYGTVIAWVTKTGHARVPFVEFVDRPTTGEHQRIAERALADAKVGA